MSTSSFYNDIQEQKLSYTELLRDRALFHTVPDDWWVIICDIKNSTDEYLGNKYRHINTVASASLAIALGIAHEKGIDIPYIYGGDGSTVIVPPDLKVPLLRVLSELKYQAEQSFGFDFRVGGVSMREVLEAGLTLGVSKCTYAREYTQPLFVDSGLYYAERMVKDSRDYQVMAKRGTTYRSYLSSIDLQWKVQYVPSASEEILCVVIEGLNLENHLDVYRTLLLEMDALYGHYEHRHPHVEYFPARQHSLTNSSLMASLLDTSTLREFIKSFQVRGRQGSRLVTDVLKVDGMLKTIIVGSPEKNKLFLEKLTICEQAGDIFFGHVRTKSALITSIIKEFDDVFLGLIDVSDGGYILAAQELKKKRGKVYGA